MRRRAGLVLALVLASTAASGDETVEPAGRRASRPEAPAWEFAATGYWNSIKGGDSYASGIFAADRGALHLEGRANYEAVHAQSLFAGWTFSAGKEEGVSLEFTPIVGGVTGAVRGPIAGFEATIAAGKVDFYVEAEYVRDREAKEGSYTYAWSELGYTPVEWLRMGLVGQRTRAYGGDREFQRGGFVQGSWGKVTAAIYWFNPGSSDQVVIGSVGVAF
jgi:hypothetical protein